MMETKDRVSGLVGLVVFALGLLPFLNRFNVGPSWFAVPWLPVKILIYVVAIAGFYLAVESIIEITNSNHIGWWSFIIASIVFAAGVLILLGPSNFGVIGFDLSKIIPLNALFYQIVFMVEGLFLMIATFAMEM